MADELLKLKWNGHLSSFLHIFQSLRLKSRYTDVTLACEGQLFTVHRLVLASCSQFFDHIFEQTPAENTVIILNEAKARDIEALLDYMYCGQVDVRQSNLASFIRTAKCLQIKGLATPDLSDELEKSKRVCSTDNEPAYKKKKSDAIPLHHPNVLSPINKSSISRHMDESPPKALSPSPVSALQNRWIFQKSDLPNTTWSTSHQQIESEGRENESFRANTIYGEEVWLADEPTSNSSPHPRKETRLQQSHPGHQETESGSPLYKPSNHFYKESADYRQSDVIDMKAEVKEEQKEYNPDDSENFASSDYSQNYSYMNTYDRENSPECYSNSVPFRRNIYPNQSAIEVHNQYNQNCLSHPLSMVKDIPPTTSQATVSPKLMPYAKCSNCLTNNTKLWRRSMKGEIVCNACGLYYKLHGVNRPSHLFRSAPMTRRRNPRKKKKLYEEIAENRDHNSTEDKIDSYCNESGCEDPENQDGLAVLNAALTLNSLFAKAKAQEAAAAAAAAAAAGKSKSDLCQPPPPPQLNLQGPIKSEGSGSQQGTTCSQMDGEVPPISDSRPPPPPLLKLHPSSSPSHLHHYSSFPPSPRVFSCDSKREREEDSQPEDDPVTV